MSSSQGPHSRFSRIPGSSGDHGSSKDEGLCRLFSVYDNNVYIFDHFTLKEDGESLNDLKLGKSPGLDNTRNCVSRCVCTIFT